MITQPNSQVNKQSNVQTKQPKAYQHKVHEAIIKFKETENHLETVKNRCIVLKVQQDKYRQKAIQQQKKIHFIEEVKKSIQKDKQKISRLQKQTFSSIYKMRQQNNKMKSQMRQKLHSTIQAKASQRIRSSQEVKQMTKNHQTLIQQYKRLDFQEKKERYNSIQQDKKNKKKNIRRFIDEKIEKIKQNNIQDNNQIIKKLQSREKQLQKLSKLQTEMIKKNVQSIQKSQIMRSRLNQVLTRNSQNKNSNSFKLPQIHSTRDSKKTSFQN